MIPEYFKAILDLLDLELNSLRPIYCYNDINKSFMMDLSLKELTPRFSKILENLSSLTRSGAEKFNQTFRKYEMGPLFVVLSLY